jgi:hypothetical protein
MQFTEGDITRCAIILALIIIIYYFYQERKLLAVEKKLNETASPSDSFVAGMWEGDDSIYRAQARAYSWCPPGDCAEKKVYAEDLVSTNPFRWPDSGGNYYMSHTEKIISKKDEAAANAQAAKSDIDDEKQQQDHETFTN